jgi:hypothetical protein
MHYVVNLIKTLLLGLIIFTLSFLSNCAFGTSRIKITHSILQKPLIKHEGKIILNKFVYRRSIMDGFECIGNKGNDFGGVLGYIALDTGKVDSILTDFIGEALKECGYKVIYNYKSNVESDIKSLPVLNGNIKEFWINSFAVANAKISIELQLLNHNGLDVWGEEINAEKVDYLFMRTNSEIETVLYGAINYALDSAIAKFSSEEFSKNIINR